ncbi:MAG TPA: M50 family metallopeptidase [Candidatus Sumerlaeota bacterium]|nr:MAG: putative zinc metalloprotease Rip3 [candidate division BRC1 bacterium ADurb.BinA292]HOR27404.1 M50 family metallopeptidase [Candidatus Sumerlaeota bacterium]HPK02889.1 M50 family metallopeptidase [Candidatus Sumerlaeota bacterium]
MPRATDISPGSQSDRRPHRPWSVYLLTVFGIPIYVHITWLLLIGFAAYVEIFRGATLLGGVLFLLAVFASIVLHELGHALVARRFGIRTDDIVLYPIGGVARLRSMGEGLQELWIALAGPAVNLLIAFALGLVLLATGGFVPVTDDSRLAGIPFAQQLLLINLLLMLFNLIPAFPMDGGRVLRSLLTLATSREKATAIAAKIGQVLAIGFLLLAPFNPILLFIGVFIFFAAGQEYAATQSVSMMSGHHVEDAMIRHFEVLHHGDSLGRAADLLLSTSQHDFPVMSGSDVIGLLTRNELIQGLALHGRDHYVAHVMTRDFPRTTPGEPLQTAFERMRDAGNLPLLVFQNDRLVGYINAENLMEYLMVRQAGRAQESRAGA